MINEGQSKVVNFAAPQVAAPFKLILGRTSYFRDHIQGSSDDVTVPLQGVVLRYHKRINEVGYGC